MRRAGTSSRQVLGPGGCTAFRSDSNSKHADPPGATRGCPWAGWVARSDSNSKHADPPGPRAQARGQFQSLTPTALLDYTAGAEVEVELLVRTTATLYRDGMQVAETGWTIYLSEMGWTLAIISSAQHRQPPLCHTAAVRHQQSGHSI